MLSLDLSFNKAVLKEPFLGVNYIQQGDIDKNSLLM